jgi:hypothetical protein
MPRNFHWLPDMVLPASTGLLLAVVIGCTDGVGPAASEGRAAYAPGVREPLALPGAEATVPAAARVIGVRVGDRARAYLIAALSLPNGNRDGVPTELSPARILGRHVVNDLVGGTPISVTYCDLSNCARVFTGSGTESLDVAIAGRRGGEMQLMLNGKRFSQHAADAPLPDFPFELTSWGEWRSKHPTSEVYVGRDTGATRGERT